MAKGCKTDHQSNFNITNINALMGFSFRSIQYRNKQEIVFQIPTFLKKENSVK